MEINSVNFSKLLLDTKDGDWGKGEAHQGYVPYRVIRGTDFADVSSGNLSNVPVRYLVESSIQRRTLQANDIIIETAGGSNDRPTGRTFFVKESLIEQSNLPLTCASFCRFLRINPEVADPYYIYWYLQYLYFRGDMWIHQVKHTGIARFQYTRFASSVQIPLPPLPEQRAIAHILGSLDDKIELNRQMNETLEGIARALFKSWFVDFDPVRAKMEGREPYGMDAQTAALFPDGFEDSVLGKIPRGWEIGSPQNVADITMGQSPPGETYNEHGNGLPFYQGIRDFGFKFPSRRIYCNAAGRIAEKGDVLLSVRAPVGSLNIAAERCIIGRGLAALHPKSSKNSFLYYMLKETQPVWNMFNANGTVFGSISKSDIQKFNVKIPPLEIEQRFNDLIDGIDCHIELNDNEMLTLTSLRDTLLPKLLSGEIRVKDAEKPEV